MQPIEPKVNASRLVFLLSPASCTGRRAGYLLRPQATFDLASRLQRGPAPGLGEVFAFMSGLYFRGKLAYASAYGRGGEGVEPVRIITPTRGLLSPSTPADAALIAEFAGIDVRLEEPRYRVPMAASVAALVDALSINDRVVLLGSIATGKYVDLLLPPLGDRLLFPPAFVGRGDMSRGGLLLRCVDDRTELEYAPLSGAIRKGARPPRLEPRPPRSGR